MSNIPHFNFKEFQDANIESANLKRERDKNEKIQQLRYERKKIEDLEKGIEEENQREQMKKEEIRNEQLKDYSEFVRKKYDKSYQYLIKNQIPIKIGEDNMKKVYYDYTQTDNSVENNPNFNFQNENYNNDIINTRHIRNYSQPNINMNIENNYDNINNERYNRYNQYLDQVSYKNSYGKVYNMLENEKKYLKDKNYYTQQSEPSSFNLPDNFYLNQNKNLNNNNVYDDYIRRNTPKPQLNVEKNQYEYNNPEITNYHQKISNEEKIQNNINNLNNNDYNNYNQIQTSNNDYNKYNQIQTSNNNYNNNNQIQTSNNNYNINNQIQTLNNNDYNNYNQIQTSNNNYNNNNYNQIHTPNNNNYNNNNFQNNEKNKPEFLDSRKEYLHNKTYNTSSIGNIITDPYTKKPQNELSDYKQRIRNERHYKELLDDQIIYTNNNYRPLRRVYTNPNPYEVIREKNSPFYEIPHDPYNLKTYNFDVTSSLPNNPITNPINSYRFRDKRKIYNEYFTNLGKILVKK